MTFEISDHALSVECKQLAKDIFADLRRAHPESEPEEWRDEADDRAHETADGHEWVIYHYKSLMICAHCDTDRGEEFVDGMGEATSDIRKLASQIVYGEMLERIREELSSLFFDYDPEDADA